MEKSTLKNMIENLDKISSALYGAPERLPDFIEASKKIDEIVDKLNEWIPYMKEIATETRKNKEFLKGAKNEKTKS